MAKSASKTTEATQKTVENNGNSTLELSYSMSYNKSTPGTHMYVADDPNALVTQLYIKKAAMPNGNLPKITVTVK